MKITCDHSASSYGIPVILDDDGNVMAYENGIRTLRFRLFLSTQQIADACGCSRRTVEGWEQGRVPQAAALNAMSALLGGQQPEPLKEKYEKILPEREL